MREAFVSANSRVWEDTVQAVPHDIYHLAAYARLCASWEGGEAHAFLAEDGGSGLFVPLIVRDVPASLSDGNGARDATVPYGYPGPLVWGDAGQPDGGFLQRAIGALVGRLRQEGIISAFLRMHPLLPIDYPVLAQFGTVVQSGGTVAIDLSLPDEELWRQLRSNHRRDVTKAIARHEIAEVDPTWIGLSGFVEAYRQTMARVGAGREYLFTDGYFAALREALPQQLHLWVVRSGADIAAGALFTECGGIVQYHLGGTFDRYLPGNPMKLLFHRATGFFKARGNRWLHLGGGVGGSHDSLMHFKLGFSPRTFPFYTWRLVADPAAYAEILARVRIDAQAPASSYFPAYRQPAGNSVHGTA